MNEFVKFEGDEAGGGDDGEKFGPAFAEEEASGFGEEKCRVDESADAEGVEFVGVDVGELFEEQVEVMIVRVDAEEVDPMLRFGDEIFVGEHVNGDADGEKSEAFEEFEGGDEHEAARMFSSGGHLRSSVAKLWNSQQVGCARD